MENENSLEQYLVGRLLSTLEAVEVFSKRIYDDRAETDNLVVRLRTAKSEGLKSKDVKEDLKKLVEVNYMSSFIYQDYTRDIEILKELYGVLTAFKVDLPITEEQKSVLDQISKDLTRVVVLDKKSVKFVNEQEYTSFITTKITDDYLDKTFNSPILT